MWHPNIKGESLPPPNEVCEGYVFTCVCLSTGGMHGRGCAWQGACMVGECAWWGSVCGRRACMAGGVHGGGHVWQRGGMHGRGAFVAVGWVAGEGMCDRGCAWWGRCMAGGMHGGGHVWQGGMYAMADTMGYGQWAGGMHPTGMHSCFFKSVNRHRAEISLPIGLVDSNIVESSQQTVAYHHLRWKWIALNL